MFGLGMGKMGAVDPPKHPGDNLLIEDGFNLLLENGTDAFLLE